MLRTIRTQESAGYSVLYAYSFLPTSLLAYKHLQYAFCADASANSDAQATEDDMIMRRLEDIAVCILEQTRYTYAHQHHTIREPKTELLTQHNSLLVNMSCYNNLPGKPQKLKLDNAWIATSALRICKATFVGGSL